MSIFFTTSADKSLVTTAGKSFKRQSLMTYTLLITLCEGVASASIKRTSTTNPSAETNITITTTSVIPVYYGDVVEITPVTETHYDICGTWPQTFNIIENASIEIDADYNPPQLTQLQQLIINGGGFVIVEEEHRATIYTNVTNPNNVPVTVTARLFNVSSHTYSEVYSSPEIIEIPANSSRDVAFDEYDDRKNFADWADPDKYVSNGALIAMYCLDPTGSNLPSRYQFWSSRYGYSSGSSLGNASKNGKITTPSISASYSAAQGTNPYNIKCTLLTGWFFPCKFNIVTPSGITEIPVEANPVRNNIFDPGAGNRFTLSISVNSLDAVLRVQLVDCSGFGFESSDEVTFNLADANNTDDDINTGNTR